MPATESALAVALAVEEEALDSATAGFVVHRTGQVEPAFAAEGRAFAVDLVGYLNDAQDAIWTALFAEAFGARDRLHWFVHMRSPHDYQRLLKMVDTDRDYQAISTSDRLAAKGGGNWERMFAPGTFQERVLCPQHGFAHPPPGAVDPARTFTTPARYQTTQPPEVQIGTATAGAVVLRTGRARYALREEARHFGVRWAEQVNLARPGEATAFLYEEVFGRQDTLHLLVHLRSLGDYARFDDDAASAGAYAELVERGMATAGGGGWDVLFEPGTLTDTLLVPVTGEQG